MPTNIDQSPNTLPDNCWMIIKPAGRSLHLLLLCHSQPGRARLATVFTSNPLSAHWPTIFSILNVCCVIKITAIFGAYKPRLVSDVSVLVLWYLQLDLSYHLSSYPQVGPITVLLLPTFNGNTFIESAPRTTFIQSAPRSPSCIMSIYVNHSWTC